MEKKPHRKSAASWRVSDNGKNEQKSARRLPELLRQAAKIIFRRFPLRI